MAEQFNYSSVLAPYMKHLLEIKSSQGISAHRTKWILKEIDDFANSEGLSDAHITEAFIRKWRAARIADCGRTLYAKYSVWSQLTRTMSRCGCECFIPRLQKQPKPDFTPYIFTPEQMSGIFTAADSLRLYDIRMGTALISIPAILRLLYGTGMRVSEALSIKTMDVHLDEHYIHLRKTKNGSERIVPLSGSLEAVLRQYMGYRNRMPVKGISSDDGLLFVKSDGTTLNQGAVYQNFRKILDMCKIPHFGNHHGPRVHDLRHTYAVHSLEQMGHSGMDLYTCLPILSTVLGHHSLTATEQYVRLTCSMYPELEGQCSEINAFVYPTMWPMTTTTDFAKHLSRFLSEYMPHERNVSPNTIASYRDAFLQFIDYMKNEKGISVDRLGLKHLTRSSVLDYLKWILEVRKCSPATRNYRLAAIHSFCWHLQYAVIEMMEQWQNILTIKAMRTEGNTLNCLSAEGVKLLLAQPDTTTRNGRRHLAILSLMYETGARVQEMADLTADSVRISHEPYTIRLYGKGRKVRIVPLLAKEQVEILRGYMEEHHLDDSSKGTSPLFFNGRHEKLTREGISYILDTYANLARKVSPDLIPERTSCHSFRHSRAMHLLQAGVNLVYIRDLLGHVSIQTTDIYARADSKAKREALEKAYADLVPNRDSEREWEKSKDLRDWLGDLGH